MSNSSRAPLAAALVAASCALLAVAVLRPPRGLCGPPVGVAQAAVALAACVMLGALILLERAGSRRGTLGGVTAAWGVALAATLLLLSCAGRVSALGGIDAVYAIGTAAALALLVAGLAGRLAISNGGRAAAGIAIAAAAGLLAAWLVNARAASKSWQTWTRVNDASAMVEEAVARKLAPERSGTLADISRELPREIKKGVAVRDAWGGDLQYAFDGTSWSVTSLGSDRTAGPRASGACPDYADDLAVRDGEPVAWPEHPCAGAKAEAAAPSGPSVLDLRHRKP